MTESMDCSIRWKNYTPKIWGPNAGLASTISLLTLAIDQANKIWLLYIYKIGPKDRIPLSPFLDIVFTKNTGISYSLFDSSSYRWQISLASLSFVASLVLWIWICRAGENRVLACGLAFIIGGAIGNAIDRLWLGGVADFYSLHAFGFYWYIFNLADVAIVAGVALLLYDFYVLSRIDAVKRE